MAQFPLDAAGILALAENMIAGLENNPGVFPAPPVSAADLRAMRDAAVSAQDSQIAVHAAGKSATEAKVAAFANLATMMKNDISYAEFTVTSPAELGLIGWGPRAEYTPLAPPGQPGSLDIPGQGPGWVKLAWEKPKSGGAPAFYRVETRTASPQGAWTLKGTATTVAAELTDLARGIEIEFRVIAENKAGQGTASNTVAAVL